MSLTSRRGRRAAQDPDSEQTVDYARRVYATAREWYTVAETKAQLLLVADGTFLTIIFGIIFGNVKDLAKVLETFGPETWVFLTVSLTAVTASVSCAAMCLLSLHGRKSEHDMAALGVRPDDPTTYRPEVLWYSDTWLGWTQPMRCNDSEALTARSK